MDWRGFYGHLYVWGPLFVVGVLLMGITAFYCTRRTDNKSHNENEGVGERGNSLLKTTFTALRDVSLCSWTID